MIGISNISVVIGGRKLLDDVSLAVSPGEIVALVGPNGAGKSTLLSVVAGDRRPTRGTISMAGRPLAEHDVEAMARMRAVVPQTVSAMMLGFDALDVVLVGRHAHRGPGASVTDTVAAHVSMRATDTLGLAAQSYDTLSGGERQRVHLARALAQLEPIDGPRALLLDEPTASLDLAHQEQFLRTIRRVAEQGVAVLMVLHDLALAARHADRIALLEKGRIVIDGPPAEVLTEARLGQVYGVAIRVLHDVDDDALIVVPRRLPRDDSRHHHAHIKETAS